MSRASLQSIHYWRTWRFVSSSDSLLKSWNPSDYSATGAIGVHPYTAIAMTAFGTNSAGLRATVQVSGFMADHDIRGTGYGVALTKYTAFLGANSAAEQPLTDGGWVSGTTYYECDLLTISSVADNNLADATEIQNDNAQSMILLPTLGYTHLMVRILLTNMTSCGVLWRPISIDSVI